jgi:hypothetical protein
LEEHFGPWRELTVENVELGRRVVLTRAARLDEIDALASPAPEPS